MGARDAEVIVLPGRTYTVEEVARVLRRRWWLILLPFVFGTAAGVLAHRRLPAEYQSETVIMVIPQRIPDSYVKSTVSTNVEDRLRSVSEQILSARGWSGLSETSTFTGHSASQGSSWKTSSRG